MDSTFTISLDFELNWGVFEKNIAFDKPYYFHNTRKVIPKLLALFEKYDVNVTWASVGMLFLQNKEEWLSHQPKHLPEYTNQNVSSYAWYTSHFSKPELEKLLFAPDLVKKITETKGQELGTHTYSHYYCLEQGQTVDDFNTDLSIAKKLAADININLRSLVFPRNQLNHEYLKVCWDHGITSVRSNPEVWYWKSDNKSTLAKKIFRTGDAYGIVPGETFYGADKIIKTPGLPIQIPASRFLRPYNDKYKILNKLRLSHIINEMTKAAEKKKFYHLWWHPHNFGFFPEESYADLEVILKHYAFLKNKFNMNSFTMSEIYDQISN